VGFSTPFGFAASPLFICGIGVARNPWEAALESRRRKFILMALGIGAALGLLARSPSIKAQEQTLH